MVHKNCFVTVLLLFIFFPIATMQHDACTHCDASTQTNDFEAMPFDNLLQIYCNRMTYRPSDTPIAYDEIENQQLQTVICERNRWKALAITLGLKTFATMGFAGISALYYAYWYGN